MVQPVALAPNGEAGPLQPDGPGRGAHRVAQLVELLAQHLAVEERHPEHPPRCASGAHAHRAQERNGRAGDLVHCLIAVRCSGRSGEGGGMSDTPRNVHLRLPA